MNWLAKINITTAIKHFGAFRSALAIVFIIVICCYSGYRIGNYYHDFQIDTLAKQKDRLELLYQMQVEQVRLIHSLEVELAVERMASQRSQAMLKDIENEHFQVKKQLAFYEKVMAPEKQADGLVIDYVKVNALESPNHYQFQVALVQQLLKKRYAKGYVDIIISGSLQGKPNKISIKKMSALTKKDLSFSFKYFQIIDGNFTLPKGFMPEAIHLSAILPKGRWQKYHKLEKTIVWPID